MADQVVFQNDPVDRSAEFRNQQNHFFVAGAASDVDPQTGRGELRWERRALEQRVSYHQVTLQLADLRLWRDMPEAENRQEEVTGHRLQHARAAWAGSQRYPLHFAGDGEVARQRMLGTLRGGLSLGLCGFTSGLTSSAGSQRRPTPTCTYAGSPSAC
jgi:hypothetical protein